MLGNPCTARVTLEGESVPYDEAIPHIERLLKSKPLKPKVVLECGAALGGGILHHPRKHYAEAYYPWVLRNRAGFINLLEEVYESVGPLPKTKEEAEDPKDAEKLVPYLPPLNPKARALFAKGDL